MIVEIRKAGFVNKGAELMLYAVIQKVKERYPDAVLVMSPQHSKGSQPYHKLAPLGFYPKAWLWQYGIQWGDLATLAPKKLREMYGVVLDKEVDVILDAAGFSYSDQWGNKSSIELARSSKRWRKNRSKVILLPQALGPYNDPRGHKYVREWAANVDLIFAREIDSYNHLVSVVGEIGKIKISPDFTNLIEGRLPDDYLLNDKRVALVPNYRMIDKTNEKDGSRYIPFMISCAKFLVEKQAMPFVLVHEGENDRILAEKISSAVGGIPIVKETDPIKIKGILGSCDATVGSRFHGLVSALSQGVPSLATGWSHKYKRLFDDYGFQEGILSVHDSEKEIKEKLELIIDNPSARRVREKLKTKSEELKKYSEEMWEYVFKVMDKKV